MFKKTRVALGQGYLDKYTIFECKWLFSIYFHIFNIIEQDRFHTHAFNAISVLFKGGYEEQQKIGHLILNKKIGCGIRYIPRFYNHRLLKSKPNTMSVVFAGPWAAFWTEEKDNSIRTLTWGRKEVPFIERTL